MTAADNLALLAGSPGGIPSIRQLVRDLAVGGRLLPDLNPDPWPVVQLADLVQSFQNGVSSRGASDGILVVVLRLADIKNGSVSLDEPRQLMLDEDTIEKYRLAVGDVLVIRVNGSADLVGRFVVCESSPGLHCDHFIRLRLDKTRIEASYLKLVGDCSATRTKIQDLFVSTAGQKTVNQTHIGSLSFALPPLPDQHRIVAKVDELMALCDQLEARQQDTEAAHARLVQALLDSLTQARDADEFQACWQRVAGQFTDLITSDAAVESLKSAAVLLAVGGRLVTQAPEDEYGSILLRRLVAAKKVAAEDARKQKEIAAEDLPAPPFDAPAGWAWAHLDQVLAISGGVTLGRKLSGRSMSTAPYLRVANVQRGRLDLTEVKEIEVPSDEIEKYRLKAGDLLITEGGDWDKVGRTTVWANELPLCLHQNHVFRARRCSDELNLRWVELYLNSPVARDYFAGASKQTTNLASINMTQLRSCAFPVPPLNEQRRIVAKVTELLALCDQLKARIAAASAKHTQLAEALVAQAVAA